MTNKGDLISREALKKTFEETCVISPMPYSFVHQIIDNAPTVAVTDYDTGYQDGLEAGLNDIRTKGEWIDYSSEGYVECPFCNSATTCEDNKDELHFCWNCGADMRKGGAE